MEHNTNLKPPKKEEEEDNEVQVPNIMNTHASAYNIKPDSNELEGILGIEDDENLPSEFQLFQDAEFWDFNGDFGVKPESSCGYWDFDDKKTSLNLSLNYQEVLEAWSNRGPLWAPSNNTYMGEVPVMEEEQGTTLSRRQASVMRYKEKRQSRLFSKKIRYQVRKLNADKRPRIKGRFVKRLGDKMQKGS